MLHLSVGQPAALDTCGRADTLDCGDLSQRGQAVGRKGAKGAPGAFELVDSRDERQNLRSDLDVVGSEHQPMIRPFTPNTVVVGRSRPTRAWIGFATAAVLALPLSISMVGDLTLIAGGLGAWVGSSTGDSRVELRLERP